MENNNTGLTELQNLYAVLCKTYDLTRQVINQLCDDLETYTTYNIATDMYLANVCDKIGGKV